MEGKKEGKRECRVTYLGLCEYQEAYRLQKKILHRRIGGEISDTLLLLQHHQVITVGRRGIWENILTGREVLDREGIRVHHVDRGGDVTYHGPGQIVGYPILDLNLHGRDVHRVVSLYEEVIIRLLARYELKGSRLPGYPGIWVDGEKVCAIGIGISHWVTFHGFALNVNTNLDHFSYITPCGITGRGVTSMSRLLGRTVDEDGVVEEIIRAFGRVFHLAMKRHTLEEQYFLAGSESGGG